MIKPVAERLRSLLQEDPSRRHCSLLITGHSAGGAVAALLYMHMLSTSKATRSELSILTSSFKRIHCVTFGAPPISLLPLQKPNNNSLRKSLFLSFINEGDPVPRADRAYVRSLLDLYSTPAPGQKRIEAVTPSRFRPWLPGHTQNKSDTALVRPASANRRPKTPRSKTTGSTPDTQKPVWKVPAATLSNAGRLVVLRAVERWQGKDGKKKERLDDGIVAVGVTDAELRGVVWGDPVCHMMKLYASRVEALATAAVTGRG
jgi:hypothetical protein